MPSIESGPSELYLRAMDHERQNQNTKAAAWITRFGFAGFMFFLIKGLLWLIVPAALAYFTWK